MKERIEAKIRNSVRMARNIANDNGVMRMPKRGVPVVVLKREPPNSPEWKRIADKLADKRRGK